MLHNAATRKNAILNMTMGSKHFIYMFSTKTVRRLAEIGAEECGCI
jgi:hypothetical protein